MTAPRVLLIDYTREEVAAMPPGPLLDWLILPVLTDCIPVDVGFEWRLFPMQVHAMSWFYRGRDTGPHHNLGPVRGAIYRISTDPGAAMGALKWLCEQPGISAFVGSADDWKLNDPWPFCCKWSDGNRHYEYADSPEHAIALATALYGWDRAAEAKGAGK